VEELLALAAAEQRVGEDEAATQALRRAALLAPSRAEPWARSASLAFDEGLPREGCSMAGRARVLDANGLDTVLAVAECALSRGDRLTALSQLKIAAKDAPRDDQAKARLEQLQRQARVE
jgi:hypothetical protein